MCKESIFNQLEEPVVGLTAKFCERVSFVLLPCFAKFYLIFALKEIVISRNFAIQDKQKNSFDDQIGNVSNNLKNKKNSVYLAGTHINSSIRDANWSSIK